MGRGELDEERRYLNKWEMYKALQGEEIGDCHLPETDLFSKAAVQRLLDAYGSVFVKPVASWGGQGISRVERQGEHVTWTLQGEQPVVYLSFASCAEAIVPVYEQGGSIVQQTAPLVSYGGRPFDLRVHLQREPEGEWVYAGHLARVSGADSIVSNVAISGGQVLPVETVLADVLGPGSFDEVVFQRRLQSAGEAICRVLDGYRIFNEIGLDLGVDDNGELWLIEVNTDDALGGPSHELFAQLPDLSVYRQMRRRYESRQLGMFKLFMAWLTEDEEASEDTNGDVNQDSEATNSKMQE